MTAMDEYYQNGPLPTWIGWYAQHLPHWFHVSTTYATLALELGLVWMLFLPRRLRIVCFVIATLWQLGVILTANYTFLNYLVLALGFLLLDDHLALTFLPRRWRSSFVDPGDQTQRPDSHSDSRNVVRASSGAIHSEASAENRRNIFHSPLSVLKISLTSIVLSCIFYATAVQLLWMVFPTIPLPTSPVAALDPFRIANRYGLFAVMTRGRYEIEFQGLQDGQVWWHILSALSRRIQASRQGSTAPYQPRFDWNLWFASLGSWREYPIVPNTEVRLLTNDPDVIALFAGNPFPGEPPREVRAVLWQYWFTTMAEKRAQGLWWRRQSMGLYAPVLERQPDGGIGVVEWPSLASGCSGWQFYELHDHPPGILRWLVEPV